MASLSPPEFTPEASTAVNSASQSTSALPVDLNNTEKDSPTPNIPKRDLQFWLVFLAICVSTLLSALDLVSDPILTGMYARSHITLLRLLSPPHFQLSSTTFMAPTMCGWAVHTRSPPLHSSPSLAGWPRSLGEDQSCSPPSSSLPSGQLSLGLLRVWKCLLPVEVCPILSRTVRELTTNLCTQLYKVSVSPLPFVMRRKVFINDYPVVGGGGILSLTEIIVADLVPLRERGTFMGVIGS